MAVGNGILWKLTLHINSDRKGFNEIFWIPEQTESAAKTAAIAIAAQRRKVLPADSSIFFAKISKNDSKRDSRYLASSIGAGQYVPPGDPAPESVYDYANTSLLIRFENEDGTSQSRKFSCIPDNVVTAGDLISTITAVTAKPNAEPAADAGNADWYAKMNRLMALVTFYCGHVVAGHQPGGQYTYFNFNGAYPMRIGHKKGARVFA